MTATPPDKPAKVSTGYSEAQLLGPKSAADGQNKFAMAEGVRALSGGLWALPVHALDQSASLCSVAPALDCRLAFSRSWRAPRAGERAQRWINETTDVSMIGWPSKKRAKGQLMVACPLQRPTG